MDGETEGTGEAQALTFGFSFPTLLGLLPTVVLIIALATVGKVRNYPSSHGFAPPGMRGVGT